VGVFVADGIGVFDDIGVLVESEIDGIVFFLVSVDVPETPIKIKKIIIAILKNFNTSSLLTSLLKTRLKTVGFTSPKTKQIIEIKNKSTNKFIMIL